MGTLGRIREGTLRTLTQVLNSPEVPRPPVAHLVAVLQWTQWNLLDREAQFDSRMRVKPFRGNWGACSAPLAMRSPLVRPQSAVGAMLTELKAAEQSLCCPLALRRAHDNKEEL